MAETVTGLEIAEQMVRRGGLGKYLLNAEIGALVAGSFTSVLHLRNGHHSTNHYRNQSAMIWRPENATGVADQVRTAGDLTPSTGVLANDANWTDTTLGAEDIILLEHGVHPLSVMDALNRALRDLYFSNEEPLSAKPIDTTIADAGFQNSGTGSYTVDATGTFTKVSTADEENVYPGFVSSGRFQAAAAGDYIKQQFAVQERETVHAFTLSRLDSGTNVEMILQDITGSAAVGTTVEHAEESWMWMKRQETVPSDSKLMDLRLAGEGGSEDFYANAFIFYRTRDTRLILDTKWETKFQVPKLAYYDIGTGYTNTSDVYNALGARVKPIPESDYSFVSARGAANPYAIQFHNTPTNPHGTHWFNYPIFIQGRRAHSDVDGPFTLALSETTSADLDLMVWASLVELFANPQILARVPNAAQTLKIATEKVASLAPQFKLATSVQPRHIVTMHGARN